jgi:predicted transcriptional regulator
VTVFSPLTVRLPDEVLADVNALASATGRCASWVILRALRHYLSGEGAQLLDIAESRQSIASGGTVDASVLIAELETMIVDRPARVA